MLSDDTHQLALGFVESDVATQRCEYFVLVTNLPHEIRTLAQLYRDRADSENTFDALKNQWGLRRLYDARSQALSLQCDGGGIDL